MNEEIELAGASTSGRLTVSKPQSNDMSALARILGQWIDETETAKYVERMAAERAGRTEYGMAFFVLKNGDGVVGVGGLADQLPVIIPRAQSANPGELKILYLDTEMRGRGYGGAFLQFLESEAKRQGRTELLVRSAEQFRETAFGFYRQAGYEDLGAINNASGQPMQLFRKVLI